MRTHSLALVGGLIASITIFSAALASPGGSQGKPDTQGEAFFEKNIRPVLVAECLGCHSDKAKQRQGGLALDTRKGLLAGGQSGASIVPGQPDKSLLIAALNYSHAKIKMPPGKRLSKREVDLFVEWVKMGAPDPRTDAPNAPAMLGGMDSEQAKNFWSLKPVRNVAVPKIKNAGLVKTPIDNFIAAKWEAKGLVPARFADRQTLIRRITFDLIGLPPTPEETAAFLADKTPNAYEKVVDRLLASPAYGEKWARYWLDLVRYADTSGCNSDFPVPSAYKYRNWVISAFNQDKPYNTFVEEQIAGDLLPAKDDPERFTKIIATGYLAITRRFGSQANEFHLSIEDMIENLGKTFLGLSVNCARCHDHKFDPVTTRDYYALYGILNSTRYAFPGTEVLSKPKDFIPLCSPEVAKEIEACEAEMSVLDEENRQLTFARANVKKTDEEVKARKEEIAKQMAAIEARKPKVELAYAVRDGKCANAKIQIKGDPKALGSEVPRGFLTVLGGQKLPEGASTSGRLELARWITDPKNPLTARVMVNRIWQGHFGVGIVSSASDFGVRGKIPTHPELLDYLATRFVESGWSIKSMHRLIVLSRAYMQSSEPNLENAKRDPTNELVWRFQPRRLMAEEIRDSILQVAGSLDPTPGAGHPFAPEKSWKYSQHKPFVAAYDTNKRSVYLMLQRIKKHPFMEVFDGVDTNMSTAERAISTTPIQALFMMNSPFAHEQASKFAERLRKSAPDPDRQLDLAYRMAFGRAPTSEEVETSKQYLRQIQADFVKAGAKETEAERSSFSSLMRVLFSSNEFLYVD